MKLDCIQKPLESAFNKYGRLVGRYPLPFIIAPVLISALLGIGLLRIYRVDDAEELYTPTNGQAKQEKAVIQNIFPENESSSFVPTRRTILDGSLQIIVKNKTAEGNVYSMIAFAEILSLDSLIKNITIQHNDLSYKYTHLCAGWNDVCIENTVLFLLNMSAESVESIPITYPFHTQLNIPYFIGNLLGSVTIGMSNNIQTAEAFYLGYSVKYQTDLEKTLADKFLRKCVEELRTWKSDSVEIHFQTSLSLDDELVSTTDSITVLFSVTYAILTTFASVSCNMLDPVRSKAWVATGGEIAAAMAILSSFGLMSAAGVPFTSTVGSVPFLIMGIGIDDMFVIISSWRHTSYTWTVEERMGKTLETAAISITVTSITDALAFGIGATTTFKAVTYFCAYAGCAVVFCYLYAVTFCAACLVYSGRIEHQNRHSTACCIQATPRDQCGGKSGCYKALCIGGDMIHLNPKTTSGQNNEKDTSNSYALPESSKKESDSEIDKETVETTKDLRFSTPLVTELIRDYFSDFLLKPVSKAVVIILYILYIGFAIWGCVSLKEGLHVKNLAPDNSYVISFYENFDTYFYSQYGPKVMVVFEDTLQYNEPSVQADIERQLQLFRDGLYYETNDNLTESWLAEYINYLTLTSQNTTDKSTFLALLQNGFLKTSGYDRFKVDINFTDSQTDIRSSRFMIQANGVSSSLNERDLMQEARRIALESPYNITVFSAGFVFFDQYVVILVNTLQNLGIAVASMMVVSVILLPSISAILFVTLSVVSICTGVIGFMVFWNVNLDSISMINLIMCIGFSVDFSAHISYHFSVSTAGNKNERAKDALTYIGWPIIQGAVSTVLGVVVLAASVTYIFRTFFKIMFLVMLFGFCHAFLLLPVILSLIGFSDTCSKRKSNSVTDTKESAKDCSIKENSNVEMVKSEKSV